MKKILHAFKPYIVEVTHDFMLAACILGPLIIGIVFRFVLPLLEHELCEQFGKAQILEPYYAIFDLLLLIMTPIMMCFSGVMVILEETDCGVAKYYAITPLGKGGYLCARIGMPMVISYIYGAALLLLFTISDMGIVMNLVLSLGSGMLAIISALLIIALAKNKMEGMALVKLSGLLIIGIPVAYFVKSPIRYLFGILPSFWMSELYITGNYAYFALIVLSSLVWIMGLYGRFKRKLM